MLTPDAYENVLTQCEDLAFLNKFQRCLRETEYRILLIVCGHTRHGKQSLKDIKRLLTEYFNQYDKPTHVENFNYLIDNALKKIIFAQTFYNVNVSRETSVKT